MTLKAIPETEEEDSVTTNDSTDEYTYCCPHCDASYADERLARVHITRADDPNHRHRNGLMPEEEVEVLDADGTVIDTRTRRPSDIDLSNVTIDDFPSELSEKRKHALLVATRNPEIDNRSELTRMVRERLEGNESAVSPPSGQTVRRALDEFYHPHTSNEQSVASNDEKLADLTPTQQAIIIAKLVLSDEPNTGIANRVGCADSYPVQLYKRKESVLRRLENRLDQGDDVETIIADELTVNALTALVEKELLSDIPLDVESLQAQMDTDDSSSTGLLVEAVDDSDPNIQQGPDWGSPVDHNTGMHAAPESPFSATTNGNDAEPSDHPHSDRELTEDNDISSDDTQDKNVDVETEHDDLADPTTVVDDDHSDPTVAGEIAALQQKIAFFRRTVQPVAETEGQMALLESFATEIERHCQVILETHGQDGA